MIDVHSRWAYALPDSRIGASSGAQFAISAQTKASFKFSTIQTDHGPEFSKWFAKKLAEQDTKIATREFVSLMTMLTLKDLIELFRMNVFLGYLTI